MPIDILMQHIINCCMGESFTTARLHKMCKNTFTYAEFPLDQLELDSILLQATYYLENIKIMSN